MIEDDILREIRESREAFAKEYDYDVYKMSAALHQMNEAGDWPMAKLEPVPPVHRKCPTCGTALTHSGRLLAEPESVPAGTDPDGRDVES